MNSPAITVPGGVTADGRPVRRRMAVPEASASRQPRGPQAHGSPSGTTITITNNLIYNSTFGGGIQIGNGYPTRRSGSASSHICGV